MAKIGFIGVGNMGGPMAINLVKAQHAVQVFDIVPELSAKVGDAGAAVMSSALDAATDADVVVSMLPASHHVEALYLGDSGLLAKLPDSTLVIDCSTISPETAKKVSAAAAERNIEMLDALSPAVSVVLKQAR